MPLITFEGIDGSGKSTQAALLVKALREIGKFAYLTREPGGTELAESIRTLLMDNPDMPAEVQSLLFTAARRDHLENLIVPMLESGSYVVCDRYIDSGEAYQTETTEKHKYHIMEILAENMPYNAIRPDLTIYLDIPINEAQKRLMDRRNDTLYARTLCEKMHDIQEAYSRIVDKDMKRFRKINAMADETTVHQQVFACVCQIL